MARFNISDTGGVAPSDYINWVEINNNPRSPKYVLEPDRSQAVRTVDVSWADVVPFCRAVLGYPIGINNDNSQHYIKRRLPWPAPIINARMDRPYLWASKCEFEGLGIDGVAGDAQYEGEDEEAEAFYNLARVTIYFDTRPYELISDQNLWSKTQGDEAGIVTFEESATDPEKTRRYARYVSAVVRPAGEFLTLQMGGWYYVTTPPSAVNARAQNKLIPSEQISMTWHQVPDYAIPAAFFNKGKPNLAIDKCLGRVNSVEFAGFAKGTLLFVAAEIRPYVSAIGDRLYDITYMFKRFQPTTDLVESNTVGHQHIFHAQGTPSPGWREIIASLNGTNVTSNFTAMTDSKNIYDWATPTQFRHLFRPASMSV